MNHLYLPEYQASLRWYDMGRGKPTLFLPGLSMPVAGGFAAVAADPVLAWRRCILLDYLGSGVSDHPVGFDYALSSHVAMILRVLDHLDVPSVDVVGHSMGGTVGIQMGIEAPERVTRLVVGEGNTDPGGGVMSRRVTDQGRDAFLAGGCDALLADLWSKAQGGSAGADRLLAGWQQADPAGIFGNAAALVDLPEDYFEQFASVPCPKTFVFGANSLGGAPTPDTPDRTRLERAGIAAAVVPDAGHAMMLDNHDGFMDALGAALG